eukprot:scaffold33370_cov58-Phaeocystis_antarctica.AAC.2
MPNPNPNPNPNPYSTPYLHAALRSLALPPPEGVARVEHALDPPGEGEGEGFQHALDPPAIRVGYPAAPPGAQQCGGDAALDLASPHGRRCHALRLASPLLHGMPLKGRPTELLEEGLRIDV